MTDAIPKRIIQTGKTRELSPVAKVSACNLKLLHPDWDYRYFDDDDVRDFLREEFPEHEALFDAFPYKIQRFDFFRYLAVHRLGGFYFDLDVMLSKDMGPTLDSHSVFPFEELTVSRHLRGRGMDWEIGNYAFGARPGDSFLGAVIENCVRAQREPGWVSPMMAGIPRMFRSDFEVLNTTGPGLVSRTLVENPELAAKVTVLFPEDVRDPATWHHVGDYGVHFMEGSWRAHGGFLRRKLAYRWEDRERKRGMAESQQQGPGRQVVAGLSAAPAGA